MDCRFDETLAKGYKSKPQKIRVMSESWLRDNIFCPCCGNRRILKLENNRPVADFLCEACGETFELKSKCGKLGNKITDGAYDTMIGRITSLTNPDLFVLQYSDRLEAENLFVIPKFFFVPSVIEKRKPLSPTARRAGWTGCNILLSQVPYQGRISVVLNKSLRDAAEVVEEYKAVKNLQTDNVEKRGWLLDVLSCVNDIKKREFSLKDVYFYREILQEKHVGNNNVEAKIRQQLQILRDKGVIEFVSRGNYRKKI